MMTAEMESRLTQIPFREFKTQAKKAMIWNLENTNIRLAIAKGLYEWVAAVESGLYQAKQTSVRQAECLECKGKSKTCKTTNKTR